MSAVLEPLQKSHGGWQLRHGRLDSLPGPFAQSQSDTIAMEAMKDAMRTFLRAVGEDPDRPGLIDTPRRVANMYAEMFEGLRTDPERHLRVTFPKHASSHLPELCEAVLRENKPTEPRCCINRLESSVEAFLTTDSQL